MKRRRDKPAQFLACFQGWCEHFQAPPVELFGEPREDRCLIYATSKWLAFLIGSPDVESWGIGIDAHKPLGGNTVTAFYGWRGTRPFAAIQIIQHRTELDDYLEIDFDLSNPGRGILPAAGHAVEWAWLRLPRLIGRSTRKTNPYRIARLMRRSGIEVEPV